MNDTETALETVVSGKFAMIDYWGAMKTTDRRTGERILRQVEAAHLAKRSWVFLSQGERQTIATSRRSLTARPRWSLTRAASISA
jgi:iron complex transport system ATP-binding protein